MSPRLKKLIVIANIVAYVVVCLGIYARRKGGFKAAFLPRKKMSIEEVVAQKRKEVPAIAVPVAKAPPAIEKKVVPLAAKPATVTPVPAKPVSPEITRADLPAHIREARVMLENMQIKEHLMKYNYYSLNRDPFVTLVGVENYLSQIKFTPDDYADLPPGLPSKPKQRSSPFTLYGTIKSRDGESAVIINDQVLQEGDIIDGYKITKIERKKVTLVSGRKVIHLEITADEVQTDTAIMQRLKELQEKKQ